MAGAYSTRQFCLIQVSFFLGIVLFSSDIKFLMRICFMYHHHIFQSRCTVSYCMAPCTTCG